MTKEKRSEKIEAKCTKKEYERVLKMASENNMTIAELVRNRVLHDHAPTYTTFESRALKILSAAAAWLELKTDKLTDKEFEEFASILKRIEGKNELSDELEKNDLEEAQ
jgi:hypothetical protein